MVRAGALRFGVLGPLEVRVDTDEPIPLGGFLQRLLLAELLMNANAVVSVDRLVDVLWGDAAPRESGSTLAKRVYRLRGAFSSVGAADVLLTRPRGYLLSLDQEQLDSARFTTLLSSAQQLLEREPARALAQFETALGLWRGPAWVDFTDHDFARAEAARLDGLRAAAVEDRAQALLALGRYTELIPQLEVIVGQYPLRERPRAQLMQALYAAGRQADALAVYREFRGYLRQEMGLDPSASLRALERDILQQKPVPGARPRPTVTAAPTHPAAGLVGYGPDRFVGRSAELAWLDVLFGRAAAGEGPVIAVLTGEPGIGKTSLVTAFARVAQARGACVVFAGCDPLLDAGAAIAAAIGHPPPTPTDTDGAGHSGSYLADALEGLSGSAPLLLILDDLNLADAGAGSLLDLLSSALFAARLCAVVTAPAPGGDVVGARAGLVTRNLTGLDRADVAELLRVVSGASRPDELVDSVCAETAGAPALVTGIGRRIRDEEITARAERAVARAEATRQGLQDARSDVTLGVLAHDRLHRDDASQLADQTARLTGEPPCPYKGLAAFGVADAEYFCGRERLVAETVAALAMDRFVGVIGASGSGKSSLIAAGLVPALAAGGLPGSDRWRCLLSRPGPEPMHALARALAPLVNLPAADVHHQLETDPGALATVARHALETGAPAGERVVLIVDQFEEVFTACTDQAARDRFLRAIVDGVSQDNDPLAVVVAMRADYYGACSDYVELARLLGQSQVLVTAMTEAELRRAVLEPARRAGLVVEDALVDAVCADALSEPGGLPLVSTALLETWIRRSGRTLTLAGYVEAGGVRGAVARLAEGVYHGFDAEGQAAVRRIFLRLADSGGPTTDVRRRADAAEVASDDADRAVLRQLIDRRLVTATEDTVEVAHEALLREWPRLHGWLEEDRDGRRLHRQLADAATLWDEEGRDEAGLYRGVRLQAARDWTAAHPGDANPLERAFLDAAEAAQQRTLHAAQRSAQRLRTLAIALAALLVLVVGAGALAVSQRSAARAEALQADVSRLATLARTLPNDQRDLALLLGAQGYQLQPSDVTVGGLQAALVQTPPGLQRVIRYRSATFGPHLDRTGRLLAVPGQDGTVTIYDLATGRTVRTLTYPSPREWAVFSSDASLVAAGGFDGTIAVWDVRTGKRSGVPLRVGGPIAWPMFDPTNNDRLYAVTGPVGELTTWDRHDPAHPRPVSPHLCCGGPDVYGGSGIPSESDAWVITISPNGRLFAGGHLFKGGTVTVHDARTGALLRSVVGTLGVFGADGVTLPIASEDEVSLYNAVTGQRGTTFNSAGDFPLARLSDDGRRIAITQNSGDIAVYDVRSRHVIGAPLNLHANGAFPVGFLPDGRLVTTGNHEAGIWSIGQALPPIARSMPAPGDYDWPVFLPGEREIVTRGRDHGMLLRHDASTGAALGPLLGGRVGPEFAASPDGALLVAPARDGSGTAIWRSATGDRLGVLPDVPDDAVLAWSPTGRVVATAAETTTAAIMVQLWDVSDPGHPVRTAVVPNVRGRGRSHILLFNHDGGLLENSGADDLGVTMIDVNDGRIRWSKVVTEPNLFQTAFSPDGRTLAVDSGDAGKGLVTLYDARTGQPRASIATQSTGGVGYVHAGQWLIATGGVARPGAQLYDAQTLQPIGVPFPIKGEAVGFRSDAFGFPVAVNDTGTLFSEGEYDAPLRWDVDPNHWQSMACSIAGRNLSHAEWNTYLPNRSYRRTCPQWPASG